MKRVMQITAGAVGELSPAVSSGPCITSGAVDRRVFEALLVDGGLGTVSVLELAAGLHALMMVMEVASWSQPSDC